MRTELRLTVIGSTAPHPSSGILVLPGLACTPEDFAPVCAPLAAAGGGVVVARYPGSDVSYRPDRHPSLEALAQSLADNLRAMPMTSVVVVGHSLGGLLGQLLAERRPELVLGFLSYEGNLAGEDCVFTRKVAAQSLHAFVGSGHASLVQSLSESESPAERAYAPRVQQMAAAAYHQYSRDIVSLSETGGLLERLSRLRCPVSYMHGERTTPPTYLNALRRMGCETEALADAGHFPFVDNHIGFAHAIARFAASARGATGDVGSRGDPYGDTGRQ